MSKQLFKSKRIYTQGSCLCKFWITIQTQKFNFTLQIASEGEAISSVTLVENAQNHPWVAVSKKVRWMDKHLQMGSSHSNLSNSAEG